METYTLEYPIDARETPPWDYPDPEGFLKGVFEQIQSLTEERNELQRELDEIKKGRDERLRDLKKRYEDRTKNVDRMIEVKVGVRTATLKDRVLKLTYELQQARRLHLK